jgi:hypothetical protein
MTKVPLVDAPKIQRELVELFPAREPPIVVPPAPGSTLFQLAAVAAALGVDIFPRVKRAREVTPEEQVAVDERLTAAEAKRRRRQQRNLKNQQEK